MTYPPRPLQPRPRLALRRRDTCALAGSGRGVWRRPRSRRSWSRKEGAMEKRGRGGNMPSSQTLQLPATAPQKERRPSMFEKESVASQWIWDVKWDSWVAAKHETETLSPDVQHFVSCFSTSLTFSQGESN
ncbi:PREDICTED: tctex1 domain-containing protein 3 isoform X2 [Hipposideros armiger]|uniref:Tctex1 domain-containing protein 3 isoform X2 n=1 Tax=Hipposideros armiger TaxID=186990 RepID=A0A8B7SSF1_HIPAR|nr:PREDICTED: tctex1 domain-containing protein 3 isoform X2 [Hipposideros armiger]